MWDFVTNILTTLDHFSVQDSMKLFLTIKTTEQIRLHRLRFPRVAKGRIALIIFSLSEQMPLNLRPSNKLLASLFSNYCLTHTRVTLLL